MALNSSKQEVVDQRRRHVARLRLRGLTQREIIEGLERIGIVNPSTDRPWGLGTINRDLEYLRAEWRRDAAADISDHVGALLAEIREVRRRAWGQNDLLNVLRGLKQERELIGADATQRKDVYDDGRIDDIWSAIVAEADAYRASDPEGETSVVDPGG